MRTEQTHTESHTGTHTHTHHPTKTAKSLFVLVYSKTAMMTSCLCAPASSPFSSSPSKEKNRRFSTKTLCLSYMGLCREDQLAGFTGSCSRLIPYSQSGTQASKPFSGHNVRSSGCVITSKITYYSYRLENEWIGNPFLLNFLEVILACLHSSTGQGTGRL